jgi:cytochrome c oxidase assembly factor CtaG
MKNNYLFKIGAFFCFFAIAITSKAQTIYTDYVDGMVWVKVTDKVIQRKVLIRTGPLQPTIAI